MLIHKVDPKTFPKWRRSGHFLVKTVRLMADTSQPSRFSCPTTIGTSKRVAISALYLLARIRTNLNHQLGELRFFCPLATNGSFPSLPAIHLLTKIITESFIRHTHQFTTWQCTLPHLLALPINDLHTSFLTVSVRYVSSFGKVLVTDRWEC